MLMMVLRFYNIIIYALLFIFWNYNTHAQSYNMPHEAELHEGTWLQWPHHYEYGIDYRNSLDATWIAMTKALQGGEKVHIIAYDEQEKDRIIALLNSENVSLTQVDFFISPTNDVWVRDSGPIFIKDENNKLLIEDWGFNGWGGKYNYDLCDPIPSSIGGATQIPIMDLNDVMVNEGGAVELDGNGVLMACRSSILNQSQSDAIRNPGMTQTQAEEIFSKYLGVQKFIWLNGNVGDPYDITDFHIDGFAKFVDDKILVTMNQSDLSYWGASASDIAKLYNASNLKDTVYKKVYLPLTKNNVFTTGGINLESKASYVNYYVANEVVLYPSYNDPNDAKAASILQSLYPQKNIIGIDCRNLFEYGGMVHCVTQQQPVTSTVGLNNLKPEIKNSQNYPNPFDETTSVLVSLDRSSDISITVYDVHGRIVSKQQAPRLEPGNHTLKINGDILQNGVYHYFIFSDKNKIASGSMMVCK